MQRIRGNNFPKTAMQRSSDADCVCYNPKGTVVCKSCGYIMIGRVRKACSRHPMTIFLMDVEQCPRCKAFSHMLIQVQERNGKVLGLD